MARNNKKAIVKSEVMKHENVINLVIEKQDLKRERLALVEEARALREKVYNKSRAINKLEEKIDSYVIKNFRDDIKTIEAKKVEE